MLALVISVIICIVIYIVILISKYILAEHFLPQLSYVVDEKRDILPIYIDKHVVNENTLSITTTSKNIMLTHDKSNSACQITDAFSILHNLKPNVSFVGTFDNEMSSLVIISPVTNTKTWSKDRFMIGYSTETQKQLLIAIINSLKDPHNVTLKPVQDTQTTRGVMDDAFFQSQGIDALCFFQTTKTMNVNKMFKLQVIDYAEEVDMKKLFVLLPYAYKSVHDFAFVFSQLKGTRAALKSVISFDTIIIANDKLQNLNVQMDILKILRFLNTPAKTNFYQMFMPTLVISLQYSQNYNEFIEKRDSRQILEQFSQSSQLPSITCESSIHGFFDVANKLFTVYDNKIEGIELAVGMKILMKHQERPYENGTYVVHSVHERHSVLHQQSSSISKISQAYAYVCYGDQSIKSKGLCESPFDELGVLKRKKTYWDRPCTMDTECPFFQANKNYPNYRGGCIDGRCEMPIGVQAVSFQKYDPNTKPLCHGCIDPTDPYCCTDQMLNQQKQRHKKYSSLKSPDYAFDIDFFERMNK